jgi:hypothetical protein
MRLISERIIQEQVTLRLHSLSETVQGDMIAKNSSSVKISHMVYNTLPLLSELMWYIFLSREEVRHLRNKLPCFVVLFLR